MMVWRGRAPYTSASRSSRGHNRADRDVWPHGGLVPCPASITVLPLCLQPKQFVLGAGLVLCFSSGLAVTMVASGAVSALSVRAASQRWSGFGEVARRAPHFSSRKPQ